MQFYVTLKFNVLRIQQVLKGIASTCGFSLLTTHPTPQVVRNVTGPPGVHHCIFRLNLNVLIRTHVNRLYSLTFCILDGVKM